MIFDWLFKEKIDRVVEDEVKTYFDSPKFEAIVVELLAKRFAAFPSNALPGSRIDFIVFMKFHLVYKWKYPHDEAGEFASWIMKEFERDEAPWGDDNYSWAAGDARELVDEFAEDR